MRPWDALRLRAAPPRSIRSRGRFDVDAVDRDRFTGSCLPEAFRAALERRCYDARRGSDPIVLFAVTLDGLDAVRERLGEREAGRMVRDASRLLATVAGPQGLVARTGAGRFEILVTAAGSGTEARFAERVQRLAARFDHWGARPYVLTFSIGAARCGSGDRIDPESLREHARHGLVPSLRRVRSAQRLGA